MVANKDVPYDSQLHRDILDAVISRRDYSRDEMGKFHQKWREAEEQVFAYLPETEVDAERRKEREDEGKPQYTTLEIPYSYALLMTGYTYWTSVFLSRTPIFQYTGRHGEGQKKVMSVESLIAYQIHTGENMVPLYCWLYDAGKYGLGVLGCYWDQQIERITEIVEENKKYMGIEIPGTAQKVKRSRDVKAYEGNKLFNIRPYDWRPDPRVAVKRFQEGEFCGRRTDVGWNTILHGAADNKYINVDELKKRRRRNAQGGSNKDSSSPVVDEPDEEGRQSGDKKEDLQTVELEEMVIEISPKEWGLGEKEKPEKWVFTVANDQVLIECRPLGYWHNKFPFQAIEYGPDTYSLCSEGMLDSVRPLNDAMTWLFNQHFYNVRRSLNDQFVYDPSRIVSKDMMSAEPGKLIRMKPSAYGQDIRQMIQQFPVQDVTRAHIDDAMSVADLMQRVSGITDNIMGQGSEGGRKSATEVRSMNTASLNRLKNVAEFFSAMGFEPLGQMMVQNTQQFYDEEQTFQIAGNQARENEDFVDVTPENVLGFFDVVPVDGTLPVDRFAMANLFKEMVGDISQLPEAAEQFDLIRMYEHAMQLSGVRNTDQFKIEVRPDEQLQQEAAEGSRVPVTGGGNGSRGNASTGGGYSDAGIAEREAGRVREPGQIPGMGASG